MSILAGLAKREEDTMQRTMSFLAGVLAGAVVGATVALLYAPMAGDELQAQVRDQVETARAEAEKAYNQRKAELEAQLAQLRGPRPSDANALPPVE